MTGAAAQARALVAAATTGTLATLTADGDPWASFVTYGLLADGAPVLLVSRLAEHGRNLAADPRAALVVTATIDAGDPIATGRVTLAGRAERPSGDEEAVARDAHLAAVPTASVYASFDDFALWVLRVERVRWVGGYGRMETIDAAAYAQRA